jgi:hypothetical protein
MQTWAIMAARQAVLTSGISLGVVSVPGWSSLERAAVGLLLAGICLAALSARRAPSCPIGPRVGQLAVAFGGVAAGGRIAAGHGGAPAWGPVAPAHGSAPVGGLVAAAHGGAPAGGRMSRFRRRVDGVLTGMLNDDDDTLTPVSKSRTTEEPVEAEEKWFQTPSTWDGDYVDALPWRRPKPPDPYPAVLPRSPDPTLAGRASAGRSSGIAGLPESSVTPWPQESPQEGARAFGDSPWLTVSATFDGEQLWPLGNRRPGQPRKRDKVEGPQVDSSAVGQPVVDGPVVDRPVVDSPVVDSPVVGRPVVDGPVVGRSVVDSPVADSPVADRTPEAARGLSDFRCVPPPEPQRGRDFEWFVASPVVDSDSAGEESTESSDERDALRWTAGPAALADEGSGGHARAADASGYRSKHRQDGTAKDKRPSDGRRSRARHAAPPGGSSAVARKR